jgi:hypothetical protein
VLRRDNLGPKLICIIRPDICQIQCKYSFRFVTGSRHLVFRCRPYARELCFIFLSGGGPVLWGRTRHGLRQKLIPTWLAYRRNANKDSGSLYCHLKLTEGHKTQDLVPPYTTTLYWDALVIIGSTTEQNKQYYWGYKCDYTIVAAYFLHWVLASPCVHWIVYIHEIKRTAGRNSTQTKVDTQWLSKPLLTVPDVCRRGRGGIRCGF